MRWCRDGNDLLLKRIKIRYGTLKDNLLLERIRNRYGYGRIIRRILCQVAMLISS